MKKIIFLFSILFFLIYSITGFCQYNWYLQSKRSAMINMNFRQPSKGLISGLNHGYYTTDNGFSWNKLVAYPFSTARAYSFIDNMNGFCVDGISLYFTSNGGLNWNYKSSSFPLASSPNDIFFVDSNTGWLTAYYGYNYIFKTTNCGLNWIYQNTGSSNDLISIYMFNKDSGYCIASSDTIFYTNDGGSNWTKQKISSYFLLKEIRFFNNNTGFILGHNAGLFKTIDGGLNWNFSSVPSSSDLYSFDFIDDNKIWVGGFFGQILKTTNAGINWITQRGNQGSSAFIISFIKFTDNNIGWFGEMNGNVYKTTNGGTNWLIDINPITGNIHSIIFKDLDTGYAVSSDANIYKSTNKGINWNSIYLASSGLSSICFTGNKIYTVGNDGLILFSTNSGLNWIQQTCITENLNSIKFFNNDFGWITGEAGKLLKTTNSGQNWIQTQSNTTKNLYSSFILNKDTVFISGGSGLFIKTTNGGVNWIDNSINTTGNNNSVYFINYNTGFLINNLLLSYPAYSKYIIYKTTNNGISWSNVWYDEQSFGDMSDKLLTSITFPDMNTGVVTSRGGNIIISTNSGNNWYITTPMKNNFNCVYFQNSLTGWIAGDNATIMTTINYGVEIKNISMEIPSGFSLSQNYPNPFNPVTRICFEIPDKVKSQRSKVKLVIYDILGKEITTLVNEQLTPGTYEVTFDGSNLPSGVYFYQLRSNEFVETKKLVLLK